MNAIYGISTAGCLLVGILALTVSFLAFGMTTVWEQQNAALMGIGALTAALVFAVMICADWLQDIHKQLKDLDALARWQAQQAQPPAPPPFAPPSDAPVVEAEKGQTN